MVTSIVSNSSYSLASLSLKSNSNVRDQAVAKIASGSQSTAGQNPLQVDSVSLRLKTSASVSANIVSNIGNALSFLEAQAKSLSHIGSLVSALGDIASKMRDPLKSATDLNNYMQEFKALRFQLTEERNATYGDQRLHDKDASSTPFSVQMNAEGTRFSSFSLSNFIANGGGGWDELIGSNTQNLLVTSGTPAETSTGTTPPTDNSSYGNSPESVANDSSSNSNTSTDNIEISGEPIGTEGYGSKDTTDTPTNLVNWGTSAFDALLSGVAAMAAENASQQSTLRHGLDAVNARSADLNALNGAITDTNLAHEVTTLAKTQLLNQSASSAFAQTNVSAEGVVKALWGEISSGIDWYKPEVLTSILPKIAFV